MIQITIYKKPDNQYKGFQVIGHADSVEEGADLVCCSVSVLTINLVNSLDATLRFSFGRFNTMEEIDICIEALKELLPVLRRYQRG